MFSLVVLFYLLDPISPCQTLRRRYYGIYALVSESLSLVRQLPCFLFVLYIYYHRRYLLFNTLPRPLVFIVYRRRSVTTKINANGDVW